MAPSATTTSAPAPAATKSPKSDAKPPPKAEAKEDKPVTAAEDDADEAEDEAEADTDADGVVIDMETFEQIIELDDEDDFSFSWGMVTAYFEQAEQAFSDMDTAFKAKDLKKLSELGHFLKGSSAALGIRKLQNTCEKMQHYGELRDEDKHSDLSSEQALKLIGGLLKGIKRDFSSAKKWFVAWYKEHGLDEASALL